MSQLLFISSRNRLFKTSANLGVLSSENKMIQSKKLNTNAPHKYIHFTYNQHTTNTGIRLLHIAKGKWKNTQQLLDFGINLNWELIHYKESGTSHAFAEVWWQICISFGSSQRRECCRWMGSYSYTSHALFAYTITKQLKKWCKTKPGWAC